MDKALLVVLSPDKRAYPAIGRFQFKDLQRRPVLGTLYIAAAIEAKGIKCEIWDQSVDNFSVNDVARGISEDKYLFVGFYSQISFKDKLVAFIGDLKMLSPSTKIVVGGPGHLYYAELLKSGCDIVCKGEAELTVGEIIDYLRGNKRIETIGGIIYKIDGVERQTADRLFVQDLDSLLLPAWHKVKFAAYYDHSILPMTGPFAPLITSRGCLYRCAFCSTPHLWRGSYRVRSVQNVIEEIDLLVYRHKIRYIIFQDDNFGIDQNWLEEFCHTVIKRGYRNLRWMCLLHPFTLRKNTQHYTRLMKKAGCNLFVFGLQAAHKTIIKKINRDPDEPEILREIIARASESDIMTSVDFICGFPGENRESIAENIRFALEAKPHLVNFHPLSIEPGSAFGTDYAGKQASSFSMEQLQNICIKANKKFYLRLNTILRILRTILRENPFFFLRLTKLYSILAKSISQEK